ncbi:hypothetical protein DUNSADRAFT_14517 [Dunaliella salina]|nr:hypothetical protein DUNSADRAFT_14517 [Dunaliella salina]|eukprot:KAF5830492.1 hypothetical protein DUNSADRAFT_14517 [Dunaliella salina]
MAQDLIAVMQAVQQDPPPWLATLAQKQQQQGGARAKRPGVRVGGGQQTVEEGSAQVGKWKRGQDAEQGWRQEQQPSQWRLDALAGEGKLSGVQRQQAEANPTQAKPGSPQSQQAEANPAQLANSGGPQSQRAQADSGSLSGFPGHNSLQSLDVSQGEDHARSSRLPGQSALVMESGDWSDAAIDVGSLLHGSAPSASTTINSSSSSSNASTEKGGPANAAAAALELSKRKKQSGVFNRYVATWWGAGPSLAPMLNSRQQYLLQRQMQWRQQQQEQQQHRLGGRGMSSSAAMGGGGGASEFDGGSGAGELSDQQLLREWSKVITKGMARLPGARMRKHLIKRGALQARKARLEKGELRSVGGRLRETSQKDRVRVRGRISSSRQDSASNAFEELGARSGSEMRGRTESSAQQQQHRGKQIGGGDDPPVAQAAPAPDFDAAVPDCAGRSTARAKPTAKPARAQQPPPRSSHLYDLF